MVGQELDAAYEDTDAVFVDVDNDGDNDLYVASGSTEFEIGSEKYHDRLYINDGKGKFLRDDDILPPQAESSQCVRASDIDHDGDIDFFVGSRSVPGRYPETPTNRILINEEGKFTIRENSAVTKVGMVTDAVWVDIDADGWDDLMVVGEWMPITSYKNSKGRLIPWPSEFRNELGQKIRTEGWWNSIAPGDFDGDGDVDFLFGNHGYNGYLRPTQDLPLYVYNRDYDSNGCPDPVLGQYTQTENGLKLSPVQTRDDIMTQLVSLKKRFFSYESFINVDFKSLMYIKELTEETYVAFTFASSYVENLGDGNYVLTALHSQCQLAPINKMSLLDFDNDGRLDVLIVGNDFSAEALYGKFDALTGLFLKGSDKGFEVIESAESGFYVPGQSHHMLPFKDRFDKMRIMATQNNDSLRIFSWL